MGQTLSYNGLTFQPDQCSFRLRKTGILGATNRINYVRYMWDINGRVNSPGYTGAGSNAANIAAVNTAVGLVENAFRDGGDLVFSLGPSMNLYSANCASGTHIRNFNWERGIDGVHGSGAEGVLRRSFTCQIYGDVIQTSDTDVTSWQESLTSSGSGGARILPVGSLNGTVQPQQVQAYTPFFCIQSGFAFGLRFRPTPPLPIFYFAPGVFYYPESLAVTEITPRRWGINRNTEFGIRWSYKAWSYSPLTGTPVTF